MWAHNINPVIFNIGFLEVRYYGLVYLLGALFVYWRLKKQKEKLNLSKKEVEDFVFWLLIGVLVGSRVFEILFYQFDYYISQPWWKVFAVWEGGMSFHGGLAGIVTTAYIYCRKKKLELLKIGDILALPTMVALALGRMANFINAELWGPITNVKWCVDFSQNEFIRNTPSGCRHPYALYEAAKRFIIAGWLVFLEKHNFRTGFLFWNFVFLEGLGRFVLDFYNVEEAVFWLTPGQWMSAVMIIIAIYFFAKNHIEDFQIIFSPRH